MMKVKTFTDFVSDRNQELDELIKSKDISKVKELFSSREELVNEAMKEYDPMTHEIMRRPDKIVKNKNGERTGVVKRWKLPINYPQYINEIALVFLYGRPVKWSNLGTGSDKAFSAFQKLVKSTRFDSKIRQCKRIAGAETQSALLFHVFRDKENKPECKLRVLAKSKGDEIYSRWDMYENLVSFAWGYNVREAGNQNSYHFDIFTPDRIYRCKRTNIGWEVDEQENLIGKIPVILFQQEKEWKGVEPLIEREEYIGSRTADTNDYFADPLFVVNAEIIKNLPEKNDENKTLIFKGAEDASKSAHYLTWDSAPESKQKEIEWLQKHILTKTFTPTIDFESMKGLSNVSGKALKQMMLLADIKASKHKEAHDELLDRVANIYISIIANVTNIALKSECDKLEISHEFQEPFGEDVAGVIDNIVSAVDAGILSKEGAIEMNPLVKNTELEKNRLKSEEEEDDLSVFDGNETGKPESYSR